VLADDLNEIVMKVLDEEGATAACGLGMSDMGERRRQERKGSEEHNTTQHVPWCWLSLRRPPSSATM